VPVAAVEHPRDFLRIGFWSLRREFGPLPLGVMSAGRADAAWERHKCCIAACFRRKHLAVVAATRFPAVVPLPLRLKTPDGCRPSRPRVAGPAAEAGVAFRSRGSTVPSRSPASLRPRHAAPRAARVRRPLPHRKRPVDSTPSDGLAVAR
jgi:hypothetical protein